MLSLCYGCHSSSLLAKVCCVVTVLQVPFFINELTVTGIELGSEVPVIRRASKPYIDNRGLWIDLDLTYNGGFHMILETKCNLMKLKKANPEEEAEKRKLKVPHARWVMVAWSAGRRSND